MSVDSNSIDMRTPSFKFSFIDDPQTTRLPATSGGNLLVYSRLSQFQRGGTQSGYGVKFVIHGEERYKVDFRPYVLGAGQYLLVNHGQEVETKVDTHSPTEGICLYFEPAFLDYVYEAILVKNPDLPGIEALRAGGTLEFCIKTYQGQGHIDVLGKALEEVAAEIRQYPQRMQETLDARMYEVAEALLISQAAIFAQIERLTSAKRTTRQELYKRLSKARNYIHANLDAPLDLDTLSQVACLSKYHFIRLFKEVYDQTPRQYLISRRLERASNLLLTSSKTFHEICHEVGLKDSSSFGRLFKRSFGATPQLYRQKYSITRMAS